MSKLMGKIILKEKEEGKTFPSEKLSVRYLRTSKCFEFRGLRLSKEREEEELIKESGMTLAEIGEKKNILVIHEDIVSCLLLTDRMSEITDRWSVGYKVTEKIGQGGLRPGEFKLLTDRELGYVRNVVGDSVFSGVGGLDTGGYFDFCVWQYVFNISETILNKVRRLWKRNKWGRSDSAWFELKVRSNNCGRVIGSKNKRGACDLDKEESDTEFAERIAHNKKVAVLKGYLAWFLEACKEECARAGVKYVREKCLQEWKEYRKILVKES